MKIILLDQGKTDDYEHTSPSLIPNTAHVTGSFSAPSKSPILKAFLREYNSAACPEAPQTDFYMTAHT